MREILFRGKRIGTGEWIYGSLVRFPNDNEIGTIVLFEEEDSSGCIVGNHYEVDLNTVGQYTGLVDKYEKKIFEGDIVYSGAFLASVEFYDGRFLPFNGEHHIFFADECKVIGNVHDILDPYGIWKSGDS